MIQLLSTALNKTLVTLLSSFQDHAQVGQVVDPIVSPFPSCSYFDRRSIAFFHRRRRAK